MKWSPRIVATFFFIILLFAIGSIVSVSLDQFKLGLYLSIMGLGIDIFGIALGFYYEWQTNLTQDQIMAVAKVFEKRERRDIMKILLRSKNLSVQEIVREFSKLGKNIDQAKVYNHLNELQIIISYHEDTTQGNRVVRYSLHKDYYRFFRRHFEVL